MTEKKIETIKAGTLLTISSGSYSAYQVHGVFRALKDITHDDYRMFAKEPYGPRREDDDDDEYFPENWEDLGHAVARMHALSFIEEVESIELMLGDHDELEPRIMEKNND